jgi:hypothetical protein
LRARNINIENSVGPGAFLAAAAVALAAALVTVAIQSYRTAQGHPVEALRYEQNGGQGRNRTTDTRIFSRGWDRLRLYISKSYRGVRCAICITVHIDAQLIHAKPTNSNLLNGRRNTRHKASWARLIQKVYEVNPLECTKTVSRDRERIHIVNIAIKLTSLIKVCLMIAIGNPSTATKSVCSSWNSC